MKRWIVAGAAVLLAVVVVVGLALGTASPTSPADRVEAIGQSIRCPVCQAESIADSPAPTAREMMDIVRDQVATGRSDGEIRSFFAARYGRWILLDPGLTPQTIALWALPALAALVGGAAVRRYLDRARPEPDGAELAELRERVTRLRADMEGTDAQ